MKQIRLWLLPLLLFASQAIASTVWVLPVKGAIGPALSDYLSREIEEAQQNGVDLVILKMDTPGGLDSSMRDIIHAITTSTVPIATWVGPSGSRAASAGTYILLASHVAAMAEATNLGAATPVALGGAPKQPSSDEGNDSTDSQPESTEKASDEVPAKTAMEKKVINDARAYIKGLARLHDRNAEWAEKAVSMAASLDATEALELNVIDFIANSPEDLVSTINGIDVKLNGKPFKLALDNPTWVERVPDWRAEMLAVITNPNVAYILMLIGIYGLLLEFYNPGIGLPGVLGGICLLLAMYALQMMPVNYVGLGLLLLGIALMIAEAFNPSFGILGLGGVVAFVLGSIFLMDSDIPGFQIALPLIFGIAIFSVGLIVITVGLLLKIRSKKATTGLENFPGKLAVVSDDFVDGTGRVQLDGALWQAKAEQKLKQGDHVTVVKIKGLTLTVKPSDRPKE
ncbi:COG1030 Membrane-bound serine protease (ClpP class) [Vibrio sp. B1FIG11]|uniref:NfeD family protein n=1 Tax=Vibrio sp. B1FIG11 TaxID=2751177 RepID=UPI001AF089A3|nr:nodulation protein NfeD [Vibrio sp. B1FIG11]CAD7825333.1 COG1030 Membrane-bound serine protease (ClpP class) [Vibrio sp. B1FIG11]CAE6955812.1 COG1030 Membrane-bound serine protease (ClpP class) [Vibrio sp. B1FIG11]